MKRSLLSKALPCFLIVVLYHSNIFSQCANNAPAQQVPYDTVFHGGGNTIYDVNFPQFDTSRIYLNFPQFDPSRGTLVGVDLQTTISVKNSYKLENQDNVTSVSRIKIIRSDIISSPALASDFESVQNKTIGIHVLNPTDNIAGSGTDYVEAGPIFAYKNYPINYSINSNLAGFLGNGQVTFNYQTQTDLYATGSNNLFTSITEDSIAFKLVYHYCTTSILPAGIADFNVKKINARNLMVSWNVPNDRAGNRYELETSRDAKNFSPVAMMAAKSTAANDYQLPYTARNNDKDKIFLRIKEYDADGLVKYSNVKTIQLDYVSSEMNLFPTIARTNVNIVFPYAPKADYRVTLLSLTGMIMQQSEFSKTNFINLSLKSRIKPGLYLVSVLNRQTLERQQSKLVVE